MPFVALRKNGYRCHQRWKKLICGFFYRKHIYVGDGYIEYDYMEFKYHNEKENMFFIFPEFNSKG